MMLKNAVVLITGAKVYAAARDPASVDLPGAVPVKGTQVIRLHVGYTDTDMTRGLDAPKSALADDISRQVKQRLSAPAPAYAA